MSHRKLIYNIMISLDGYMEGPNEDLSWPVIDEELHTFVNRQEEGIGLWLYGRRMYALMEAFWPAADQDPANPAYIAEFARIYREKPKLVFSHTLNQVEGPKARLAAGSLLDEARRLKNEDGLDMEVSGAELASGLIQQGLVDEYLFYIHPVILGGGRRALPALERPAQLKLLESRTFSSGVVYVRYGAG